MANIMESVKKFIDNGFEYIDESGKLFTDEKVTEVLQKEYISAIKEGFQDIKESFFDFKIRMLVDSYTRLDEVLNELNKIVKHEKSFPYTLTQKTSQPDSVPATKTSQPDSVPATKTSQPDSVPATKTSQPDSVPEKKKSEKKGCEKVQK